MEDAITGITKTEMLQVSHLIPECLSDLIDPTHLSRTDEVSSEALPPTPNRSRNSSERRGSM